MKTIFLFTISILLQMSLVAQTPATWKLKKEVDGLKVYTRKGEGSNIQEVKVNFSVDASLSNVVALLNDVAAAPEWVYSCKETRVVKQVSPTEAIYYGRVAVPFPLNDRDYVVNSKMAQSAKTKEILITTTNVPNHLPAVENCVRIPKLTVKWKIKPLAADKTQVDYYLASDPGGTIPDWLINATIDKGPVNSIKKLKEMLPQAKYRDAKLAYVKNYTAPQVATKSTVSSRQ